MLGVVHFTHWKNLCVINESCKVTEGAVSEASQPTQIQHSFPLPRTPCSQVDSCPFLSAAKELLEVQQCNIKAYLLYLRVSLLFLPTVVLCFGLGGINYRVVRKWRRFKVLGKGYGVKSREPGKRP